MKTHILLSLFIATHCASALTISQDNRKENNEEQKPNILHINQTFQAKKHNISLLVANDFSQMGFSDLFAFGLHYKQPNTFFRLQGRMSLEFEGFIGTKQSSALNQIIFGVAQDVTLPLFIDGLYVGAGIGIYIRSILDTRMNSAFTFGEKAFIGYRHDITGGGGYYL